MPATITTTANASTNVTKKQRTKKARIVRRRGRGGMDSDDEIEREAQTDSGTEDDSAYTSESDTESVSDEEHHAGIVTPSTTQSPPPLDLPGGSASGKPTLVNGASGPFVGTTDWAQLVADENAHGAQDLPVIDFADMRSHAIPEPAPAQPARPRKAKAPKATKKDTTAAPASQQPSSTTTETPAAAAEPDHQPQPEEHGDLTAEEPIASTSTVPPREPNRFRGQSARQAYQERLQADPAFVPRVGEFWGHDDRLLDKDLRSLSGWWRGRWQNRGRGRGFAMRGRGGRGGFFPGPPGREEQERDGEEKEKVAEEKPEVPPIDRAWGHDGFEEMKRREEHRRDEQRRSQVSRQSAGSQRGRGSFVARGRGGFSRGGGVAPPMATGLPRAGPRADPSSTSVWYTMKPEKMWTKHADNFLYFEQALRPRPGEAAGIRVKLPGLKDVRVVRQKKIHSRSFSQVTTAASTSGSTADDGERHFVVRIPHPVKPETTPQATTDSAPTVQQAQTEDSEPSIEEVFTVRPQVVPEYVPIASPPVARIPTTVEPASADATSAAPSDTPPQHPGSQLPTVSAGPSPQIQEALLRNPPVQELHAPVPQAASPESSRAAPVLHPIQTSFSPAPQQSPPYGSPYTYGTLPPGIGMHQGYPYELATGRPVYLHPTPPPMYAPQPMMRSYMGHPATSMPFVPGHMHHTSQEYLPHAHTPPVNGFVDPSTGVPIFAPARQSSRIEIRAPSGEVKAAKHAPRPSHLRTSTIEGDVEQLCVEQTEAQEQEQQQAGAEHAMMAYPAYQQPYYYPDPNGYPGYMDMSAQVVQYDMYPPYEQHAQPVIYSTLR